MNEALSSLEGIRNGDLSTEKIKSLQDLADSKQFEEQVEEFCSEEISKLLENNQDLTKKEYNILVTLHINNNEFLKNFIDIDGPKDLSQNDIENYKFLTNNQELIEDQIQNIETDKNFLGANEFVESLIMLDSLDEDSVGNISKLYKKLANDEKIVGIYKQVYQYFPDVPDNIIGNLRTDIQKKQINIEEKQKNKNLENKVHQEENEKKDKEETKHNKEETKHNKKETNNENDEIIEDKEQTKNTLKMTQKEQNKYQERLDGLSKDAKKIEEDMQKELGMDGVEFERAKRQAEKRVKKQIEKQNPGLADKFDINQLATIGAFQIIAAGLESDNAQIQAFQSEAESLFGDLEVSFKETFDNISQNSEVLDRVVDEKYNTDKLNKLVNKFGEGSKQKLEKFVNNVDQQINSSILDSISNSLGSMGDDIEIQEKSLESDKETFLSTKVNLAGHQDEIKFQRDGDIHLNRFVTQGVNVKRETDSIIRFENDNFDFQGLGNMNEFRDDIWKKIMNMDSIDELESIDIQKLDGDGLGDVDDLTKDALEHSLKAQGLQSKMMEFYPEDIDIESLNNGSSIQNQQLSEYMKIVIYSSNRASIREIQKAKSNFDRLDEMKEDILEQDLEGKNIDQAMQILDDNEDSLVNGLKDKKFDFVRADEKGDRYIDFDKFDVFVESLESQIQK